MMTGVWYGARYGGSTTSILVNIPGEAASVMTCLDGYQMTKKGRAGAALAWWRSGLSSRAPSASSGCSSSRRAGQRRAVFGPPEYSVLHDLRLRPAVRTWRRDSPLKGALMIALGLCIGAIGINPMDSYPRFTFGSEQLMLGIDFLPIAMGLFGVSEILNIAVDKYVKPQIRRSACAIFIRARRKCGAR